MNVKHRLNTGIKLIYLFYKSGKIKNEIIIKNEIFGKVGSSLGA